jgi:hypothetical protein
MQPLDLVEAYISQGQLSRALQLWLLVSCCSVQPADAVAVMHVSMCSSVLASITVHPQDRCPLLRPSSCATFHVLLLTNSHPSHSSLQCAQAMQLLLDVQPSPAALPLILEMRKNLCPSPILPYFMPCIYQQQLALYFVDVLFPSAPLTPCQMHVAGPTRRLEWGV